jgi:hypothetical protein
MTCDAQLWGTSKGPACPTGRDAPRRAPDGADVPSVRHRRPAGPHGRCGEARRPARCCADAGSQLPAPRSSTVSKDAHTYLWREPSKASGHESGRGSAGSSSSAAARRQVTIRFTVSASCSSGPYPIRPFKHVADRGAPLARSHRRTALGEAPPCERRQRHGLRAARTGMGYTTCTWLSIMRAALPAAQLLLVGNGS